MDLIRRSASMPLFARTGQGARLSRRCCGCRSGRTLISGTRDWLGRERKGANEAFNVTKCDSLRRMSGGMAEALT